MKNKNLSLLTIGIFSFLVVSGSVRAFHHPNHVLDPTPAQIEKFCKEYPNKKPSEQLQLKKQYDKYCKKPKSTPIVKKPKSTPIVKKPVIKPIVKKPVIKRLAIKGKCVTAKDEIRILGRDFGKQGSVRLRHDGKESPLKARRWAPTDIRIVLSGKFKPGKRYTLSVKTAGGKSNQKALFVCKKKPQLPVEPGPTPLPGKADLTVKLKSPEKATAGEAIPKLRMEAKNQGKAQAKGFTLELVLSKYRRITKRTGLMMKADGQVLETIRLGTPLAPNGRKDYFPKAKLPADMPAGKYYLCARIDPANKVKESIENNNTHCKRIEVAAGKDFKPELKAPNIQPRQRQFIDMDMGLTINDSILPASVPARGTAEVAWNFPADSEVTWVYLRIEEGAFSGPCPTGQRGWAGREELERLDTGWKAFPDRRNYPDPSRRVSISLSPDRGFRPGRTYSFQACGMRALAGGGREYVHESNVVTMQYGFFGFLPDLIVSEIQMSEDPSEMGRILIRFKDANRTRPFRQWYEMFVRGRRDAGLASDMEKIYPFEYIIFVDGRRIPGPARQSYLPPSGRKHVLDYNHSLPADGRLHRVEVRVTPIGRADQRSDNNSTVRDLRVEPVRIRITVSGLSEMFVLYDGDPRSPGELLTLRAELGVVGSSGRLVSWGREGEDVERDVRVAGRGEIRNITSGALYGSSLPDYILIRDGDHLRVVFGGDVEIETTTDKAVRMNFDAQEDDCPDFAPCTPWGHYRIDVPIRSFWPMLDRCIAGVNTLNLAVMPRSHFVPSSDDPGGPSIRPISGQVCITRIP